MAERSWSAQFIGLLESLRMPSRFQQGRRYARAGHVRQLTVSSSVATALVVDDDGETYRARVAVRAFGSSDWSRVERALAEQAVHTAKLLAGQVPPDLDVVFARLGLSLLPQDLSDLALDCTCADPRIPCAHLAAACYALADSFDADPLRVLAWRGRDREQLLEGLRDRYVRPVPVVREPEPDVAPASFWTAGPRAARPERPVPGTVRRPDAVLEELDPLDLQAGRFEVTELLRPVYRAIAGTIDAPWSGFEPRPLGSAGGGQELGGG